MNIEKILIELREITTGWRDDANRPQYEDYRTGLLEAAKDLEDYVRLLQSQRVIEATKSELKRSKDEH